ncbi:MAG: hypothetical protein SCM96_11570 [Acidobacteriota bacterium]|nr:hypothetical protein [Acidobacteriota bacterium]
MRNKTIVKAVALFVCLAFIGLSVPGLLAADKKAAKIDARSFLQKPFMMLASIFPGLIPIFDINPDKTQAPSDNFGKGAIVKPTGEIRPGKPSGED